jgi:hypothetical protein
MSAPPPPPPPPSSSKKGCLIAAAIVVGVLVLLCGGGFVWVATHPTAMVAWGVDKLHQASLATMTAEVTPEMRQEFDTEMTAYSSWLRTPEAMAQMKSGNQAGMAPMQALQSAISDQKFTPDEVQGVIDAARKAHAATP